MAFGISLTFGAVPAWFASRVAPEHALRRGTSTKRAWYLGKSLLVLQIGLTFILLVGSGLLIRTYYVLRNRRAIIALPTQAVILKLRGFSSGGPHSKVEPTLCGAVA